MGKLCSTLPRLIMLKLAGGDYACCLWETQIDHCIPAIATSSGLSFASHGRPVIIFNSGRSGLDFGLGTRFKVESCFLLCLGLRCDLISVLSLPCQLKFVRRLIDVLPTPSAGRMPGEKKKG